MCNCRLPWPGDWVMEPPRGGPSRSWGDLRDPPGDRARGTQHGVRRLPQYRAGGIRASPKQPACTVHQRMTTILTSFVQMQSPTSSSRATAEPRHTSPDATMHSSEESPTGEPSPASSTLQVSSSMGMGKVRPTGCVPVRTMLGGKVFGSRETHRTLASFTGAPSVHDQAPAGEVDGGGAL